VNTYVNSNSTITGCASCQQFIDDRTGITIIRAGDPAGRPPPGTSSSTRSSRATSSPGLLRVARDLPDHRQRDRQRGADTRIINNVWDRDANGIGIGADPARNDLVQDVEVANNTFRTQDTGSTSPGTARVRPARDIELDRSGARGTDMSEFDISSPAYRAFRRR